MYNGPGLSHGSLYYNNKVDPTSRWILQKTHKYNTSKNSTISELRRFYKFNYKYIEILPNSTLFDISNGFIESNNRNINLYYNRARGFKDIDYFLNTINVFFV